MKARQILANNIVYYRTKNCWTQEKLAELLDTSAAYVSEMENEKRNISVDYIDYIANIFKIKPYELLLNRKPVENRRINKGKK